MARSVVEPEGCYEMGFAATTVVRPAVGDLVPWLQRGYLAVVENSAKTVLAFRIESCAAIYEQREKTCYDMPLESSMLSIQGLEWEVLRRAGSESRRIA